MLLQRFVLALCWVLLAHAKRRTLLATSVVTCMQNLQLTAEYFNVSFSADTRALRYNLQMTTEVEGYVVAYVDVYAYGFKIISREVDLCNIGWKQFCPLYKGNIDIDSIEYISEEYVNMIPGIAYQVPDIDAVAVVRLQKNDSLAQVACVQAYFGNSKTVSHIGVSWSTALIAGIGLVTLALLLTFGNSVAALHISANAVSLFFYFQNTVIVAMMHVERLPPIAAAWSENLAWLMGLIRTEFMQKIFRWYVQATGGTPDLFLTSSTKSVLTQRGVEEPVPGVFRRMFNTPVGHYFKRTGYEIRLNAYLVIYRGIQRLGYRLRIELSLIVVTGFTFFILCGLLIGGIVCVFSSLLVLARRWGWIGDGRYTYVKTHFNVILKGTILRYIFIGFSQLVILGTWEFTQRDSPAVVFLACLMIVFACATMGWACYRTLTFGQQLVAKYQNPAAKLYGDSHVLNKYGFFYTMFNAQRYWWGAVVLVYTFCKCLFIGLAQASGRVQAVCVFVLDLAYTIYLIRTKPYLDRWTNGINYAMLVVNTFNLFLFLFFLQLFGQPLQVGAIMAWVFFILNAAFLLVLLLLVIYLVVRALTSKNPDLRFAPATDDRTSFQRQALQKRDKSGALTGIDELTALGAAAQTHDKNWELELHKLNDMSNPLGLLPSDLFESSSQLGTPKRLVAANPLDRTFTEQEALRSETGLTGLMGLIRGRLYRKPAAEESDEYEFEDQRPVNLAESARHSVRHSRQESAAISNLEPVNPVDVTGR